jgi:lipid A 3-O-deacylase
MDLRMRQSGPSPLTHRLAAALAGALTLVALPQPGRSDDTQRLTLLEENDSLYFNSDKHYTQGFLASYLGPDVRPESDWNRFFGLFPSGAGEVSRRTALEFGQSIFTPKQVQLIPPDPHDRPYAGWLYVGANLLQDTDRRTLDSLDIEVGVVGPAALGKEVQNDFHQLIGKNQAQGWSSQLQNEPGLLVSYDRSWRAPLIGDGISGVDFVPVLGASLGNVLIDGEAGGLLRIGRNLQADYGPNRVRPALSGTSYFNGDYLQGDLGYYFFAGAQGRIVGHNIFLDGNTLRDSRSVTRKTFVADLQSGFSVFWSRAWRVDFSVDRRTEEFEGQATPDVIGTAALSFSW